MSFFNRYLPDEPPKRVYIGMPGVEPPVTKSQPSTVEIDADGNDDCGPLTFIGEATVVTHSRPILLSSERDIEKIDVLEVSGTIIDDHDETPFRASGESIDPWIIEAVRNAVYREGV